jgi:aspartyl-tRNA(Asn)/glutamyl-tRNA(Gln) amidotransferase subunit C
MAVSEDDVRHIAALARLGLEPGRIALLARELNGILSHMEAIAAADVEGGASVGASASGFGSVPAATPLRTDGDQAPLSIASREAFAPSMRDGFFLVPRLGTHDDEGDEG